MSAFFAYFFKILFSTFFLHIYFKLKHAKKVGGVSNSINLKFKIGMAQPIPCDEGKYCPPGSIEPLLCDAGTYGDEKEYRTSQECKPCSPGKYCPNRGMTGAVDECEAGFYCESGAKVKNPQDGITGDICPIGKYCPQGSEAPEPCDPGNFTPFTGATKKEDCIECYPGFYCPGEVGSLSRIPCEPGDYCEPASKKSEKM